MITATPLGKTVKIVTVNSDIIVENIDEYVTGFGYLYFRLMNGSTESFSREHVLAAYRRLPTGEWRQIHLKKIKNYESIPSDSQDE